jgi:hypothetical protein
MIHTHKCTHCSTELTCCCESRLQIDRMTGKPRVFECVDCMRLGANIVQDALEEAFKFAKASYKFGPTERLKGVSDS